MVPVSGTATEHPMPHYLLMSKSQADTELLPCPTGALQGRANAEPFASVINHPDCFTLGELNCIKKNLPPDILGIFSQGIKSCIH